MNRSWKFLFHLTLLALSACVLPGSGSPDPNAAMTESAPAPTNTRTFTPEPTFTPTFTPTLIYPTPRVPSETPTITDTPAGPTDTPGPTATLTPFLVELSVSRPTNCRTGPGKEYDVVGSLVPGVTVPVIGRDGSSQFWYIPNPYVFTDYCWVSGEYATLNGPQFLVPLVASGNTPTPTGSPAPVLAFKLKSGSKQVCNGLHWMNFNITNEGYTVLQSIKIVVQDQNKNLVRSTTSDNFPLANGCNSAVINDNITITGGITNVSGPKFDYNFQGNKLVATVTICSEDGLQGVCKTESIALNP